jgi:hypothetical protein
MKNIKILILMLSLQVTILLPFAIHAQTPGMFITSGGSITSSGPSNIYINDGDLINNGNFSSSGGSTITMKGSLAQSIGGVAKSTFENLVVDNENGLTVNNNIYIKTLLKMEAGLITTGSDTVVINTAGNISGAAVDKYIDGYCRKVGITAFTFPIGSHGIYAPIGISDGEAGDINDYFTASWVDGAAPYDTTMHDPDIKRISSQEYWILERKGTSNVYVTLSWNAHSGGVNSPTDLTVAHWNGSFWEDAGNSAAAGTFTDGTVTSNLVESFSPFTLASKSLEHNTLPIQLLSIDAKRFSDHADVHWTTATETNNDYFTVEHSPDASNWQFVTIVKGAGNSNSILSYKTTDTDPYQGVTYYRLKQTDFDGKYEYVGIASCSTGNIVATDEKPVVNVSSDHTIQVSVESGSNHAAHINVLDITGKLIKSGDVELIKGGNTFYLNAEELNAGMYIVSFVSEVGSHTAKVILE